MPIAHQLDLLLKQPIYGRLSYLLLGQRTELTCSHKVLPISSSAVLSRLLPSQYLFAKVGLFGWNFRRELGIEYVFPSIGVMFRSLHNSSIIDIIVSIQQFIYQQFQRNVHTSGNPPQKIAIIEQEIYRKQFLNLIQIQIIPFTYIQMTSFNVQSEFLDLKKTYQHFEYPNLIGEGHVDGTQAGKIQERYEGMTQNTYLFVQQKQTLIKDTENISLYFSHKYCESNSKINEQAYKKFPFEKVRDRICFIFQKYQEQPTLLDTLLEPLVLPIMNAVKQYLYILMKNKEQQQISCVDMHSLLQIIYQLTKVRGQKYVIQHFPHEVKDLYPALSYLVRQRINTTYWYPQYVVLLWLGVIVLVPFNLDIIDSGVITLPTQNGTNVTEIVDVMIEVGKYYLRSLTKLRQASALFLSNLFTRPDIQKRGMLPLYMKYTLQKLKEVGHKPLENFFVCGLYESLCNIFKKVQRSQLLPLIPGVLAQLAFQKQSKNATRKQVTMKLLTRLGLTYLKPRVAVWAFRKKHQSLLNNLSGCTKTKLMTNTHLVVQSKTKGQMHLNSSGTQDDTSYYSDVDKVNLEEIIDLLVQGLTQKETTVRQQASKGLGAIAGRLSLDMVLDILDYILSLTPTPQTQHAVCLTIAELIRRNLLSPQKVSSLYPFMAEALLYQKEEGGYSVGQAVRDAACYMTWSVARAYAQGGYQLGISLIIAACFDREVGCRRAASAAYQQLVGRVGDVPHGIQVLTEADYFTLGPQKNAYLNVAIFIASYEDYYKPFVEHLCHQKLRHWDLEIKRIAACSLSLMVSLNPAFIGRDIIQAMLKYMDSDILTVKLGAIIGLSEILLGLKGLSHLHMMHNQMKDSVFLKSLTQNEKKLLKAGQYMESFKSKYQANRYQDNFRFTDEEALRAIIDNLKIKIKDGKLYKGKAGQNFRIYTCRLLESFAICKINLKQQDITIFKDFIQQNIKNPQEPILFASVKCLQPFLTTYHSINDEKYINNLIHQAKTSQSYARCYTLTLSKLSKDIYLHHFNQIVEVIENNCKIAKENNDPEKRKYAIQAIQALIEEVGFSSEKLNQQGITKLFDILSRTIQDYTMDKRGDIGSIVREESMSAMINIIRVYCSTTNPRWKINDTIVTRMIGLLLQQLNQKIDRIRLLSGSLLQTFFDNYFKYFNLPHSNELLAIFGQQNVRKLVREADLKIDSNLQTQVIKMEMKIQESVFSEEHERYIIYLWNLPHNVYPLTVPLLGLPQYRRYVLKGLCTSTGGLSESIIKHSLQELGNYLTKMRQNNNQGQLQGLMETMIDLMKAHYKDERIIVPLYKTLDFLLEREELIGWEGLRKYDTQIYYLIEKQLNKTKSILKVSAATGLFVSLLSLNNQQTKAGVLNSIVKILVSDLPKARKVLADKLLLFLMSQEDYVIFNEQQTELLILLLSDNDFLDQKLEVNKIQAEIDSILAA